MSQSVCVVITLDELAQLAVRVDAQTREAPLESMAVESMGYRSGVGLAVHLTTKVKGDAPAT